MNGMRIYHKRSAGLNPSDNSSFSHSSRVMAPGIYRYPEVKNPLRRQVHAPSRILKVGRDRSRREVTNNVFGAFLTRNCNIFNRSAFDLPLRLETEEVVNADDEVANVEMISDDTSMEGDFVDKVAMEVDEVEEKVEKENGFSSEPVNLKNGSLMVDDGSQANQKSSLVWSRPVTDVSSYEAYRKGLESAKNRNSKAKARGYGDVLKERWHALLRTFGFWKQDEEPVEDLKREAFLPLSKEGKTAVKCAFSAHNLDVLVTHKNSNIDITGEILRCLKPGAWLNDELVNSRTGYNYGSVKRWTSMKKLGYRVIDCDKIFIPIHMSIHWTLAVINIKDQKFQYLDSFKGREPQILNALARYFVDEVKHKSEVDVDLSRWSQEFVDELPMQRNGFDCGMFMLKYIDFYSRGLDLSFTEEHMPYFRVRTAKEILQLKAD